MKNKIFIIFFIVLSAIILPVIIWLNILPAAVSSPKIIGYAQDILNKNFGVQTVVVNPVLKTSLSPVVEFSIDNFEMTNNDGRIFALSNFNITISLKDIPSKKILLKKAGADLIYADINKLLSLDFRKEKEQKPKNEWSVDVYDSVLYLKKSLILYSPKSDTEVKLTANDLKVDNTQKEQRFLHFNLDAEIKKAGKILSFSLDDRNSVYFKDNHFYIKKAFLDMNKSRIFFDMEADRKKNYVLDIYSEKIFVDEVLTFINSQIIENNLQETLAYFKDMKGSFNFNIRITNDDLKGTVNLNNVNAKIVPFADIPITLANGQILMTKDRITLKDIKGFYDNNGENTITMAGTVDDYLKTIKTKLTIRSVVSNGFMRYLSKIVGMPVELTGGSARTKLEMNAINNKIDMKWLFGLSKGQDILVDNTSVGAASIPKGVSGDIHLENNILTIRSLDYYMVPERFLTKENKDKIKPILKFKGNIDIANNAEIRDLGFSIPKPLPSEFLNFIIKERIFKEGKISGEMTYIMRNGVPVLDGELKMERVKMPSQRLYFKEAELSAKSDGEIKISSKGGYRRSRYDIKGLLVNELKFPLIIKDLNLTVDNIDVERFLASANNQKSEAIKTDKFDLTPSGEAKDDDDDSPTFDIGNFVVEKGLVNINNGKYRDMEFSDIKADLTLNKYSDLLINSNNFNIASGSASAKINCNLKKHKYSMLLDVKDVDAEVIAANILNMQREISGKSSGIIDLQTDETFKLNGKMTFDIKDGVIQKIGLVEYILTVATIFRNPLTMVSPAILSDLINVPEGRFDNISGRMTLKDNVIERIMIKSTAPQLSAFVVGYYNLNNSDASLRVYTKFSNRTKGILGFLRSISLNRLANSIPLSRRNDANYYEAELAMLPDIDAPEKDTQVYLTKIDGDIEHNNFISSLKKIK